MKKKSKNGQSLNKAIDLLDYFTRHNEAGVTQISSELRMPKSTTHYILNILKNRGFIDQDTESHKYRLGVKIFEIGVQWASPRDIERVSHTYVKQLSNELREIVQLSILLDNEAFIIDRYEPSPPFVILPQVRYKLPLYCTASGKILLAYLEADNLNRILKNLRLIKNTPNTIIEITKFKEDLLQISKQGYSFDNEEHFKGICCCAAPVRDDSGKVVAALSVMLPADKYPKTKYIKLVKKVVKQARLISLALGYIDVKKTH